MGWSPISSISFEMYRRVQPRQAWPPNAGHQKSSRMPALNLGNSSDHQLNDEVDGFGVASSFPTISVIAKWLRMGNAAKPSIPEQIPVPPRAAGLVRYVCRSIRPSASTCSNRHLSGPPCLDTHRREATIVGRRIASCALPLRVKWLTAKFARGMSDRFDPCKRRAPEQEASADTRRRRGSALARRRRRAADPMRSPRTYSSPQSRFRPERPRFTNLYRQRRRQACTRHDDTRPTKHS
jgi:hypothetical protein